MVAQTPQPVGIVEGSTFRVLHREDIKRETVGGGE